MGVKFLDMSGNKWNKMANEQITNNFKTIKTKQDKKINLSRYFNYGNNNNKSANY